jgi:hypothetical protein
MPEPFRFDAGWHFDDPIVRFDSFVPDPTPPHVMTPDNRISATMLAADITAIQTAIATIHTKLPFLLSISNAERQEMAKLGEKSMGFDEKCGAYMASNPEFLPGFVQLAEVDKDRALRAQIMEFWPQIQTLCESLDDTLMIVNSELWMADLAFYQTVREAAKRGRAGADTIYNDLKQRFPGGNAQPTPPPGP